MPVDGGREAVDQIADDGLSTGHPHELVLFVIIENGMALLSLEAVLLEYAERNQIDISIED